MKIKRNPRSKFGCNKLLAKLQYFTTNFFRRTSAHGLVHIASMGVHLIERILWTTCVCAAIYGAVSLSQGLWNRFQTSPTVISMDRNKFFWNTSFPSLTICPHKKIDPEKLEAYYLANPQEFKTDADKEEFAHFMKVLGNISFENLDQLPMNRTFGIASSDYLDLVWNLSWAFDPAINSGTTYKLHIVDTITELGICYAVNSNVATYNSYRYWKSNSWYVIKPNQSVVVHPLDGEIYAQVINLTTSYEVYFHGAAEVPDVSRQRYSFSGSDYTTIELLALEILTTADAKDLTVSQRKCRFTEEGNDLNISPVYSMNICRMECRRNLAYQICKCIPHFYRPIGKNGKIYPICDFEGIKCLITIKKELLDLKSTELKINCKCEQNCDDSHFFIQAFRSRPWFLGANLQWGINNYPKMQLIRDVLFRFTDLLGGTAGLFLGCSLLSITEIIYFFTWRIVKFLLSRNWKNFY